MLGTDNPPRYSAAGLSFNAPTGVVGSLHLKFLTALSSADFSLAPLARPFFCIEDQQHFFSGRLSPARPIPPLLLLSSLLLGLKKIREPF
jgi:hypothetical protein